MPTRPRDHAAAHAIDWTLEQRWLCRVARASVPAATVDACAGAAAGLDWNALADLAEQHGVAELLAAQSGAATYPIPSEVAERLARRAQGAVAVNLALIRQTADLLTRLRQDGIRALTFKGPALASSVYGHLSRRFSTDIDILVHPGDASRVRPLLLADGYTLPPRRTRRAGSLLYGLVPGTGRDDTLLPSRANQAPVDVHVGFAFWTQGIRLDADALFNRAVAVDVAGVSLPTLDRIDLLLVLAIHGMMHGWCTLRQIADIDALVGQIDDWDAAVDRAAVARMRRVLWVALLVSHRVLDADVPRSVLERAARDRQALEIAAGIESRLFDPPRAEWHPKPWFLSFQDSAAGRLRFHARDVIYEWFLKWPWDEWLGRRRTPGAWS